MHDRYGDEPVDDTPDREWAARQARAMAVVNCEFCDDQGYRGSSPCNHVDYRSIAARGMAKVREALRKAEK